MKKTGWIILGIVAVLALLGSGWFAYSGDLSCHSWGTTAGRGMMGGFGRFPIGILGGVSMLLFWGLVIGGTIWLVTRVTRSQPQLSAPAPAGAAPLDVLKQRYAAGEINKEQFDEIKRSLGA